MGESVLVLVAIGVLCALLAIGITKILAGSDHRRAARYPQLSMTPTMTWANTARGAREAPTGARAAPPIEPGDPPSIGSRFQDRYGIVGELGAGAFGNVCLAEDTATGHRVAIRLLPRWFADAPDRAHAVQRLGQSMVATSTAHPGMVRVLEFGETDDEQLFAAMELVEGRRLSEILAEGQPTDVGVALRLALDLGGPVEALHRVGLVHGALCPRNVMVLEDGRVKLMDVELAGLRDTRPPDGVIVARPPAEYRSPEQIHRAPVTETTDVYAFAVILYELLCGVPPFQAATRESVLTMHLTQAPLPMRQRRNAVPDSVERLVTQALHKEPERRPLMEDVLRLLEGEAGLGGEPDRVGVRQEEAPGPMSETEMREQRLLVPRWLAESQRMLEVTRGERTAMAEAFGGLVDRLVQLKRAADEIARGLRAKR